MKEFDVIVIGAGVAGITLAKKCAVAGLEVALIENNHLGGKSLHGGGVFIHHLFQALKELHSIKNLGLSGVIGDTSSFYVDYPALIQSYFEKRNRLVHDFSNDLKTDKIHFLSGKASLIDNHTVTVLDVSYHAKYIVLANGSSLNIPDYVGLDLALNSGLAIEPTEIMNMIDKPNEVVIIGGGRISYELTYFYASIGTKVTVLSNSVITHTLDSDVNDVLLGFIRNPLVQLIIKPESLHFTQDEVCYTQNHKSYTLKPDRIILATGYGFNNELLGNVKLNYDDQGIFTDDYLKTNIDNIYAIGDANNKPKMTNVAIEEANVAANNIIGTATSMRYHRFIHTLMGVYEYAYIGLSETEIIKTQEPYYVAKFSLFKEDRLYTRLDTPFIKILLSKTRDEVLGIHMIGNEAGDEIAQLYHLLKPNEEQGVVMIPTYSKLNEIHNRINHIKKDYHTKLIEHMYSVYQRIYSNQTQQVVGFESLSRFVIDDQIRPTLPIIEMLERSGYIRQLDKKSVDNAILTLKKLSDKTLNISINIASSTLINTPSNYFYTLITDAGLSPNNITFEITERQLIDQDTVLEAMFNLKKEGFRISLDDFSVGHASLLTLDKFPFSEIKIDRALLPKDENDLNAISTYKYLVDLIKEYDVMIVCEGIETKFQYQFVKSLKVDYLQGYYLAKPQII